MSVAVADDYIPPMPAIPDRPIPKWRTLLRSRGDLLSLFSREDFEHQVMSLRLLARRLLVANNPETVRDVFVLRHDIYQRKSSIVEQALRPVIGDSYFISYGPEWERRRAALAPLLHPSELGRFHPIMVDVAEEMAERWLAAGDRPFDVALEMAAANATVIIRCLTGTPFPIERAVPLAAAFGTFQRRIGNSDFLDMLGFPAWTPRPHSPTALIMARRIKKIAEDLIAAASPDTGMIARMRAILGDDGQPLLNAEQLRNEVCTMMLAGFEGSANVQAWTWFLLSQHRDSAATINGELARVLGGRAPAPEDLTALPFTRALLNETMRLYPPVSFLARQAMKPDRIRRWDVAPGTVIVAIPWLLHRHSRLWKAPHAFHPERFLGAAARSVPKFAYIPFGVGPRVCSGAAFGMNEMMIMTAVLAQRVRVGLLPGSRVMPRCRLTLRPMGGIPMQAAPL